MQRTASAHPGTASKEKAPVLRLSLLGRFQAERGGQPIPDAAWQRPRVRTLVKLVAVEPDHRLHREQIEEILWPDLEPDAAANNFRKTLSLARHALEPGLLPRESSSYLHLSRDVLWLDPACVWVDADHFQRLAREALTSRGIEAFELALATYTGELLPEDRYEEWAEARRASLTDLRLRLLIGLAELLEGRGAHEEAALRLQEAVTHDPAREDLHRHLMRLYVLTGSRHRALRQYQVCEEALRTYCDATPEPTTTELYAAIQTGGVFPQASTAPQQTSVGARLPAAVQGMEPVPFIGRDRPRELLLEELFSSRRSENPRPRGIVLIGGEAGVGKTRLAAEVAREATAHGALSLWGASYEEEGPRPYAPFVEALEGYLAACGRAERDAIASRYPELVRLLPLRAPSVGSEPSWALPAGDASHLFAALARLLTELAAARRILLVLDDLHVADTASLQLLHYLARMAHERGWLLVGTYREEELRPDSGLRHIVTRLTRTGLCRRVDLLRLGQAECDELVRAALGSELDPAVAEYTFARSLGNPLFTLELIRELQERGRLVQVNGRWSWSDDRVPRRRDEAPPVPLQVRELIGERVDRMGEDARRIVTLAGIVGMEFSFALLAAAWKQVFQPPISDGLLLDALDRALEAQIVEERGYGYAFRHPLFQGALYERVSRERRLYLHAAVVRALEEEQPDEVEALAYHAARAADREKVALYTERAGDRAAAVYANGAAVEQYRGAIDGLVNLGQASNAARVREKLGAVLRLASRYDEALEVLEAAERAYRTDGDQECLGRVAAQIGQIYAFKGEPDKGIARLQPLVKLLEDHGPSTALGTLHLALAALYFPAGRYLEMLAAATRAGQVARSIGDDGLLAEAELRRGTALGSVGRVVEGAEAMQEAVARAEASGNLRILPVALNNLGDNYAGQGRIEAARACLERAVRVARQVGDNVWIRNTTGTLGEILFVLGDWDGARACIRDVTTSLQPAQSGPSWQHAYPLRWQARLDLAEGRWDEAERKLAEAIAIAERCGELQMLRSATLLFAELDLERGHPERAVRRLEPLADSREIGAAELLPVLASAYLGTGDVTRAEETVACAVERAETANVRLLVVEALRVQGMVFTHQRRWDAANQAFDAAVSMARSMPFPYAEARALCEYGKMFAEKGEWQQAVERLKRALTVFQGLGASPQVEKSRHALRGLPPPGAVPQKPDRPAQD